jgi:hypothetical protein
MAKIEINPADLDGSCEALGNALMDYAESNEPEIELENNGIGSYEYWGAKGYDEGTNFATLDDSKLETFTIDTSGCDLDFVSDLLLGIKEEPFGRKEFHFHMRRGNDVVVKYDFMVIMVIIERNNITLKACWVEK